jgi:hypothetical protein
VFANLNIINRPWDKDKMCVGKDWFLGFLKTNWGISLGKLKFYREKEQRDGIIQQLTIF